MGLIIAGVSSGSGKTTLTIGLMRSFVDRGLKVGAFKAGPDYIDPMFHRMAMRGSSYNLPSWMVDDSAIEHLYRKRSKDKDISVIEGVMGYYDGHSHESIEGSTAHLADVLNEDVLLIIDGSSMALTSAAIVKGLVEFHEPSAIKGVVFNQIRSKMHYELLKKSVETHTQIKCYGYLMPSDEVQMESRHLGLVQASEDDEIEEKICKMSELVQATVDVERIIRDFSNPKQTRCKTESVSGDDGDDFDERIEKKLAQIRQKIEDRGGLTLGIAKDQAFSFYYDENLETLKELGVKLVPFSPMTDAVVPTSADALYMGGGYPEVFAKVLEENSTFKRNLKQQVENGLPIYAECGGLMYLTNSITNLEGVKNQMTQIVGGDSVMTKSLQRFGHVSVDLNPSKLLMTELPPIHYRGHEFHHSLVENCPATCILEVSKKNNSWSCGYHLKNVLATYVHYHFYSNLDLLETLIDLFIINRKSEIKSRGESCLI